MWDSRDGLCHLVGKRRRKACLCKQEKPGVGVTLGQAYSSGL